MGKRAIKIQVSQLSQNRINKNNNIPCNKKQLNNLIKLLKPKVYITSCSNFKNLVQQLTGNGSINPISSVHHESTVILHPTQNLKAMGEVNQDIMNPYENTDKINDVQTYSQIESYQESINQDSSEGSMLLPFTIHESEGQAHSMTESHQQSINQELSVDSLEGGMPSSFTTIHESSIQKSSITDSQEMIFSEEYKKMESWLLEIDTCSNYHHYEGNVPLVQEQVSLCDNYDSYLSNILH
uniref:VQ domain-containing protein n=1 Tax=Solanum tuberosum TaxID=4113 RepID=M1DHH2_SOLTU